jgi:hypothetical protein
MRWMDMLAILFLLTIDYLLGMNSACRFIPLELFFVFGIICNCHIQFYYDYKQNFVFSALVSDEK